MIYESKFDFFNMISQLSKIIRKYNHYRTSKIGRGDVLLGESLCFMVKFYTPVKIILLRAGRICLAEFVNILPRFSPTLDDEYAEKR